MNWNCRRQAKAFFIPVVMAVAMALVPPSGGAQPPAQESGAKMPAGQAAKILTVAEAILKAWNIPGAAIGVVKDGKILFLEGFGKRDVEKNLPVTPQTRFILGSTTKAFTTMAIGLLAAEKKLDWDKPVSSFLPDFRLMDEYASLHATVRDLAAHRTGLPRHDLVWVNSPMDLEEMVRVLRYLEPSRELRTAFQYNNLMYITLGYLVDKAAGVPWDACVREKIFKPLAMTQSGCTIPEYTAAGEHAFSYRFEEKKQVAQPLPQPTEKLMYGARASGSVNTTAADMCRWITAHLQAGEVDGNQVFPANVVRETHSPQIPIPWNPASATETLSPLCPRLDDRYVPRALASSSRRLDPGIQFLCVAFPPGENRNRRLDQCLFAGEQYPGQLRLGRCPRALPHRLDKARRRADEGGPPVPAAGEGGRGHPAGA